MRIKLGLLLLAFSLCASTVHAAEWRDATMPASFKRLNTLAMISRTDAWAGGRDGLVLRWNGDSWQRQGVDVTGDVVAIEFPSANAGWMVTYDVGTQKSTLQKYNGIDWSSREIPNDIRATAMTVSSDGTVWIFGHGGRIIRFTDGVWSETLSPGYRTVLGATGTRDGNVWAVGEFGTVWKWDTVRWASVQTPIETHLNAIACNDSGDVWIVGDGGVVLRFRDGRWKKVQTPSTAHLYGIHVSENDSVWICGRDILMSGTENTLQIDTASIHGQIRAIQVLPDGSGWAVGYGVLLHRYPDRDLTNTRERLGFYRIELLPNLLGVRGVSFADVTNDGLDDLYIVAVRDANHLLINEGNGQFLDVTGRAGVMGTVAVVPLLQQTVECCAAWGDFDNDGRLDLMVAGWHGATALYRQTEDGTFQNVTSRLPLGDGPLSLNSAIFGDVNGDGWIDLFVTNEHGSNRLWINNGRGRWRDETERWGLTSHGGSKQAVFADFDNDGKLDLYVANWHRQNDIYRNDGDRFVSLSESCVAAGDTARSNGVTVGDIDNDGNIDIVVTRSGSQNSIYRNTGNWEFVDESGIVAFASGPNSHGSALADFDNDGDLDLVIANSDGISYFENVGGFSFVPRLIEGLSDVVDAGAIAVADIDQDGDQDMFIGSQTDFVDRMSDYRQRRSACFINKLDSRSAISVRMRSHFLNSHAIGGRVILRRQDSNGTRSSVGMREITSGSGYLAQHSAAAHFGVDTTSLYSVEATFPGGKTVYVEDVRAGANIIVWKEHGVAAFIAIAQRILWNRIWSDVARMHFWPLLLLVPLMVYSIRVASIRFAWSSIVTTAFTLFVSLLYALLAVATAATTGWLARFTPSIAVAAMLVLLFAISYWSDSLVLRRITRRRQIRALAERANLTEALASSLSTRELGEIALRELSNTIPLCDPVLCICDPKNGRIDITIPETDIPGFKRNEAHCFDENSTASLVWDDDRLPLDSRNGYSRVGIPLIARDTHIGAIYAYVATTDVDRIRDSESALHGFLSLLAMSLYNAQVQQQVRREEAEYRKWLQVQSGFTQPSESARSIHRNILRKLELVRKHAPAPIGSLESITGESPAIEELVERVLQVAPTDTTVLLLGESGTGKELVARTIHCQSRRASGEFVAVNCGAIAEGLLESELFGHVKGAFTGAHAGRSGVFQRADGGTIFLDEIAEMNPSAQIRLLRVIQERKITPVGSDSEVSVDVRVIAATHRDLSEAVSKGTFREDLYYRLNVFSMTLPPLRDRIEDISILIANTIHRISDRNRSPIVGISEDAVEHMIEHRWPGNVRELENVIERAMLLAEGGLIEPEHLQFAKPNRDLRMGDTPSRNDNLVGQTLSDVERDLIEQTLKACDNNVSETARRLGITRDMLRYRMKKYSIRRSSS